MQTADFVSGLHNCLEFSQPLLFLYQATQTRKTFSIAWMLTETDSSGRLLLFKALNKEENFTIAIIYGHNKDVEAVPFCHKLRLCWGVVELMLKLHERLEADKKEMLICSDDEEEIGVVTATSRFMRWDLNKNYGFFEVIVLTCSKQRKSLWKY